MAATLVISDLHLGSASGGDLLRREDVREALLSSLDGIRRVVLLGDAIELRQGPLRDAMAAARPFFEQLGATLGAAREVVLVPGNHDHALVEPWLERRRREQAPPPLRLEEQVQWRDGDAVAEIAGWLAPARLTLAYPGIWLRDDVYALHGHYLDRHTTVPTFERLSAGVMGRIVGPLPATGAAPDDYERALAPIYAWSYALAQQALDGSRAARGTQGVSVRVWRTLAGDGHRPLRRRALASLFPLGIAAINRAGIGPVRADVSGTAIGTAGTRAMADAAAALALDAAHVVFGHTHRAGPRAADDPAVWTTASGARLHNCGTWVFERQFLSRAPYESPYWPGRAVLVDDDPSIPPRLLRLLGDRAWDDLAGER
ncbi:metallophosphoesterase [Conexibacter arvalis]|uniref:Putative phosphodiesterase n=1 Tax=Conexibacter arvalis TaxID=912552 RepID=A0A840IE65_9ACTN|nr:putative phosphodiesterase [Conexibacter arvalis]